MDAKRAASPFAWVVHTKEDRYGLPMNREEPHAFFDTLYQQYYPRVLAYFRFRVGKADVAEDLASLAFERALTHLSEREQEIIGLKFAAHLTNRQIARVLHLPEGTVGSLLYRTLGKLRNALHEDGGTA